MLAGVVEVTVAEAELPADGVDDDDEDEDDDEEDEEEEELEADEGAITELVGEAAWWGFWCNRWLVWWFR